MATKREKQIETIARAIRLLAAAELDYDLVLHVPDTSAPLFFSNVEPPQGVQRVRESLDAIEKFTGLAVVEVKSEH